MISRIMPVDLRDIFAAISDSLVAKFTLTSEGENRLGKGEKREEILKEFLRENLPPTFQVESDEIFDTQGSVSKQMDVIIFNSTMPALRSKALSLFPVDSVLAACEVKTDLDKTRLEEAVENIQSVKKMILARPAMHYGAFKDRVYGMVFAFDATQSTIRQSLVEIYEKLKVPKDQQIDLICVLNKFIGIGYPKEQGLVMESEGKDLADQPLVLMNTGRDSLLFLIPIMLGGLNKPISPFFNFWRYMRPAGYQLF